MTTSRTSIILLFFGIVVGCSDVGFQAVPSKTCVAFNNGGDQTCVFSPNGNDYSVTFKTGQIDILVVNDNSRSMSPEHRKMGDAFSGFINSIGNLDYRIAMVTTDIVKGKGLLVEFSDEQGRKSGEKFLTSSSPNLISKFRGTVARQETLSCDAGTASSCGSDDERGIYAANLAITKNEGSWLRPGAHLAIIALADEDQRSGTVFDVNTGKWVGMHAKFGDVLESLDFPETLVSDFTSSFASKSMSFHSVIVVPGDTTCLNQQTVYVNPITGQPYMTPLRGSYGNLYQQLSQSTQNQLNQYGQIVDGSVVDICSSSYYAGLNLIGSLVKANADQYSIQMQCLPNTDDITIDASQQVDYYIDSNTKKIIFQNLPFGVDIKASWKCPNSV